jgi:hypothetical protein
MLVMQPNAPFVNVPKFLAQEVVFFCPSQEIRVKRKSLSILNLEGHKPIPEKSEPCLVFVPGSQFVLSKQTYKYEKYTCLKVHGISPFTKNSNAKDVTK